MDRTISFHKQVTVSCLQKTQRGQDEFIVLTQAISVQDENVKISDIKQKLKRNDPNALVDHSQCFTNSMKIQDDQTLKEMGYTEDQMIFIIPENILRDPKDKRYHYMNSLKLKFEPDFTLYEHSIEEIMRKTNTEKTINDGVKNIIELLLQDFIHLITRLSEPIASKISSKSLSIVLDMVLDKGLLKLAKEQGQLALKTFQDKVQGSFPEGKFNWYLFLKSGGKLLSLIQYLVKIESRSAYSNIDISTDFVEQKIRMVSENYTLCYVIYLSMVCAYLIAEIFEVTMKVVGQRERINEIDLLNGIAQDKELKDLVETLSGNKVDILNQVQDNYSCDRTVSEDSEMEDLSQFDEIEFHPIRRAPSEYSTSSTDELENKMSRLSEIAQSSDLVTFGQYLLENFEHEGAKVKLSAKFWQKTPQHIIKTLMKIYDPNLYDPEQDFIYRKLYRILEDLKKTYCKRRY